MNPNLTEITVVGNDDTGLLARITSLLFEHGINIEDLDQQVQKGVFRMKMSVDTTQMSCTKAELRANLEMVCEELHMDLQLRFHSDSQTRSIAVLVTKESHCLEALLEATASGELPADIEVVIGNHSTLEPIASMYDVPFHDIGDEDGTPNEDELLTLLEEYEVDVIALARYIRILSPEIVFRYDNRIINVHPSLLPAFPGAAAYLQAIEGGVRIAGVTAHYVTPDLDQGPIITQRAFNVPDDTSTDDLRERGQPLEAEALIEALRLHLNDAIEIGRGRTHVDEETETTLGLPDEIKRLNPSLPINN